jgi:hypothetical protein
LPADRPGNRPGGERPAQRPEQRPDWAERSENRNNDWQQRVDSRHDSWGKWQDQTQDRRNDFQNNREDRWDRLQSGREDRQDWRDQNREDWQSHREDLWEYRGDRADEIWDDVGDWHDDCFDDHWWGACGWVGHYHGHYPVNPWWWWRPVGWAAVAGFVAASTPDPIYVDYGMTVIYEGETVYVDGKAVPAAQYSEPMKEMAATVPQPPPPLPPEEGKEAEWMPLGVFALAQEEKGQPVMFFQLSVNREGIITGGYQSLISGDQKPVAGKVDKATQMAAWRIGDNTEFIYTTSLANLTQDLCTVAIHFGEETTQTWLLVRMPEPAPAGQEQKLPTAPKTPPPLTKAK